MQLHMQIVEMPEKRGRSGIFPPLSTPPDNGSFQTRYASACDRQTVASASADRYADMV